MSVAFVFPGQGSQSVGMGKALADQFPSAKAVFDEVDEALGFKLSGVIFSGPPEALTLTANTQPALMAVSLAALRVLEQEAGVDVARDAVLLAGHSLGEYSALAAARSLTVSDAARLLRIRGQAMQQATPVGIGAMASIFGFDLETGRRIAAEAQTRAGPGEVCEVANDNGAGQLVVSGTKSAVEQAVAGAKSLGSAKFMFLPVSAPFHCSLMQPAAETMRAALAEVDIKTPTTPIIANVVAEPVTDPDRIRALLVAQVTGTVRWRECVQAMVDRGASSFVEVGAGKVLTGLLRRMHPALKAVTVGTADDISAYAQLG
jgi:[acyl-carrier-protein] S-malonyltransferase